MVGRRNIDVGGDRKLPGFLVSAWAAGRARRSAPSARARAAAAHAAAIDRLSSIDQVLD